MYIIIIIYGFWLKTHSVSLSRTRLERQQVVSLWPLAGSKSLQYQIKKSAHKNPHTYGRRQYKWVSENSRSSLLFFINCFSRFFFLHQFLLIHIESDWNIYVYTLINEIRAHLIYLYSFTWIFIYHIFRFALSLSLYLSLTLFIYLQFVWFWWEIHIACDQSMGQSIKSK